MTLIISSAFNGVSDPDAAAYIQAVEAADGELLEFAVGRAINDFVLGCKADGIWDAIKASCIMAGARTLNGALVPLVGTAPTPYAFLPSDYNRKTGLVGDGSTKYLDSNFSDSLVPQDDIHMSAWVSSYPLVSNSRLIGTAPTTNRSSTFLQYYNNQYFVYNRSPGFPSLLNLTIKSLGFLGTARSQPSSFLARTSDSNVTGVSTSAPTLGTNAVVFGYQAFGSASATSLTDARLAFYSIGEALDLAKLDARVTDLINKFAEVIP